MTVNPPSQPQGYSPEPKLLVWVARAVSGGTSSLVFSFGESSDGLDVGFAVQAFGLQNRAHLPCISHWDLLRKIGRADPSVLQGLYQSFTSYNSWNSKILPSELPPSRRRAQMSPDKP